MYEISRTHIGATLRRLREARNLRQIDLAERLAMPQSYVSKLETGERALRAGEVFSYAEALGMSGIELLIEVGRTGTGRTTR